MSYRILHDRSNLNQRSGWNDQHGGLFRILMPKDQGNDQTKKTYCRHHAENCWYAKLTFQDRQNKDAESPILATPAAKPLAVARSCVGNKLGASVNVVELGPAFINKLNRMKPANTRGM